MDQEKISRYPGIRAFEINERNLFFGRAMETRKLFAMVKAKPLVVLFAKSGIGKSSLINASLLPRLDHDLYRSVRIRIQDNTQNPISTVKAELSDYLDADKLATFSGKDAESASLWEYLRACQFSEGENTRIPVLIFDQFEEFFLHPPEVREAMTEELANLVSERMPQEIRTQLRSVPFKDRSEELLDWCSPIPVKIIMAIRSDRLSLMDELSDAIPSILHNRFHLQPMLAKQAEAAILEPARLSGHHFLSPKFEYDKPSLIQILTSLVNQNNEVESFQLQLVCQHIENEIIRKNKTGEQVMVTPSLYGGPLGIDNILHDYYENAIARLNKEEEKKARKFIEEGLIVDGRRVGVNAGVEQRSFGIDEKLLTKLLHSRLIRAQDTHLGRSYEISHDTLVDPILRSYGLRLKREEEEENERQIQIQKELLAKEKKKKYRAIIFAALGFVLFIASAFSAYKNYDLLVKSHRQNQMMEASQLAVSAILQSETYGNITKATSMAQSALYKTSKEEDRFQAKRALLNAAYKNVGEGRNLFYQNKLPFQEAEILDVAVSNDRQNIAIAYRTGKLRIQSWDLDTLSQILFPHTDDIVKVLFSPDGQYLLSASKDNTASIRDLSGKEIGRVTHDLAVTAIDFTPDGHFFMTSSLDKKVRIWTLNGELYQELNGHSRGVMGAKFYNQGKNVLSWGVDGIALLWNKEGDILHELINGDAVLDAAISPDEKWIVTGNVNNDIILWDTTGREKETFFGHESEVRGLRFSPDSRTVLSWDGNGDFILWTLGGDKREFVTNAHEAAISSAEFSMDGKKILTTSHDNSAKVWTKGGRLIAKCFGHDLGINGGFFLPETEKVLTYSADHRIRLWETEKSIIKKLGRKFKSVIVSDISSSNEFLLAENEGEFSIYKNDGTHSHSFAVDLNGGVSKVLFHPDGEWFAAAGNNGDLKFLEKDGKERAFIQHSSSISWLDFSADGNTLAVALSESDSLRLYDTDGQEIRKIGTGEVQRLAFTPIGKKDDSRIIDIDLDYIGRRAGDPLLLTIGKGKNLFLWNYETGEKIDSLQINTTQVLDACFSADGRKIVGGCLDRVTRVWDLDGEILEEFKQQNAAIFAVDVTPDNRHIVSAAGDGTFLVREFNGDVLVRGKGLSMVKPFAAFTPDGKFLLTSVDVEDTDGDEIHRLLWPFGHEEILQTYLK